MANTSSGDRVAVLAADAPQPPPFLSQAIRQGDFIFCSGQIGVDPKTGTLIKGTVGDRTVSCLFSQASIMWLKPTNISPQAQILRNLSAVLTQAGSNLALVNKVNIFLVDPDDFNSMNKVYTTFFEDPKPVSYQKNYDRNGMIRTKTRQARTCVFVKALPLGTDVEIECIAGLDSSKPKL